MSIEIVVTPFSYPGIMPMSSFGMGTDRLASDSALQ